MSSPEFDNLMNSIVTTSNKFAVFANLESNQNDGSQSDDEFVDAIGEEELHDAQDEEDEMEVTLNAAHHEEIFDIEDKIWPRQEELIEEHSTNDTKPSADDARSVASSPASSMYASDSEDVTEPSAPESATSSNAMHLSQLFSKSETWSNSTGESNMNSLHLSVDSPHISNQRQLDSPSTLHISSTFQTDAVYEAPDNLLSSFQHENIIDTDSEEEVVEFEGSETDAVSPDLPPPPSYEEASSMQDSHASLRSLPSSHLLDVHRSVSESKSVSSPLPPLIPLVEEAEYSGDFGLSISNSQLGLSHESLDLERSSTEASPQPQECNEQQFVQIDLEEKPASPPPSPQQHPAAQEPLSPVPVPVKNHDVGNQSEESSTQNQLSSHQAPMHDVHVDDDLSTEEALAQQPLSLEPVPIEVIRTDAHSNEEVAYQELEPALNIDTHTNASSSIPERTAPVPAPEQPAPLSATLQLMECINGQISLNAHTIEVLRKNFECVANKPIFILSVAGNARLGKSTFFNLFLVATQEQREKERRASSSPTSSSPVPPQPLHENALFATGSQIDTLTRGLWVHPYPVHFSKGYALLVDCEGLDLSDDHATGLLYLFAMLFCTTFTIHDTKTLHNKTLSQLALSLHLLKEISDPQSFMPRVLFVLRDTKDLVWNKERVDDPEVILEHIFHPDQPSADISLINKCLHEKFLTHLPSPPDTMLDTTNASEFFESVRDSALYDKFSHDVMQTLHQISRPKCHAKSSLCMNMDEIIQDLYKIQALFNENNIARIPSVLESHVMQKCEHLTAKAEESLEREIRVFVVQNHPSSAQIRAFAQQAQEEVLHEFITNSHFLEDTDLKTNQYIKKLRKNLDRIVTLHVDTKLKQELHEKAEQEKKKRIEAEIERAKLEDLHREKRRRKLEEKARRLKEQQMAEDKKSETAWEINAELYRSQQEDKERLKDLLHLGQDSVIWQNRGVLMKGNDRIHTIGPVPADGSYRLTIQNLTESGILTPRCFIEPNIRVGQERAGLNSQIETEESFILRLQCGDVIHLELRVLVSSGKWKSWVTMSSNVSVDYKCKLEHLG